MLGYPVNPEILIRVFTCVSIPGGNDERPCHYARGLRPGTYQEAGGLQQPHPTEKKEEGGEKEGAGALMEAAGNSNARQTNLCTRLDA